MADLTSKILTTLPSEEVIVRSLQFFPSANFRAGSQSGRVATFDGKPPIPWLMLFLTFLGFWLCVLPGVIMYFCAIRKMYRLYNIVVTATPIFGGTEVSITHPGWSTAAVRRFLFSLPQLSTPLGIGCGSNATTHTPPPIPHFATQPLLLGSIENPVEPEMKQDSIFDLPPTKETVDGIQTAEITYDQDGSAVSYFPIARDGSIIGEFTKEEITQQLSDGILLSSDYIYDGNNWKLLQH